MKTAHRENRIRWSILLLFPLACAQCLTIASGSGLAAGPDKVDLQQVRADWQGRLRRTESMFYRLVGTATKLKGTVVDANDPDLPPGVDVGDGYPKEDYTHACNVTWLFDLKHNLFRKEVEDQSFSVPMLIWCPSFKVEGFDGSHFWTYAPKDGRNSSEQCPNRHKVDIAIQTDHRTVWNFTAFDQPVLMAHGLFPLSGVFEHRNLRGLSVDHLTLQSVGTARIDQRVCWVARALPPGSDRAEPGYDQFWIDPQRQSAVLRWERYFRGKIYARLEIDYQETAHGWLPRGWKTTWYKAEVDPPTVVSMYRTIVEELKVNESPKRSEFEMPLKPGMLILDKTADYRTYRVAADGKTLEDFRPRNAPPPAQKGSTYTTLLIVNGIILALLGSAFVYRRILRAKR